MKFACLLAGAAFAAEKRQWTRVEQLLDSVNESLVDAQTYIDEEIRPTIEDLNESTNDLWDTIDEQIVSKDWSQYQNWDEVQAQLENIDWEKISSKIKATDVKKKVDWIYVDTQVDYLNSQVDYVNEQVELANQKVNQIDWEKIESHYDALNEQVNSIDWDEIHAQMEKVNNVDWANVKRGDYDWQATLDSVVEKVNASVASVDELLNKVDDVETVEEPILYN